jgi:multidrug efflux system membrane fusion protein
VLLTLGVQPKAVVVPSQAVQSGQSGSYAFVVKQDQTAELRPVTVSRSTNGETVIEKGLSAGETVVTDGHLLLTSGARVSVRDQNPVRQENPKK